MTTPVIFGTSRTLDDVPRIEGQHIWSWAALLVATLFMAVAR